jgi:hypothetical protein
MWIASTRSSRSSSLSGWLACVMFFGCLGAGFEAFMLFLETLINHNSFPCWCFDSKHLCFGVLSCWMMAIIRAFVFYEWSRVKREVNRVCARLVGAQPECETCDIVVHTYFGVVTSLNALSKRNQKTHQTSDIRHQTPEKLPCQTDVSCPLSEGERQPGSVKS